ncbi:hypothetical protein ES332_A06G141900v1 [Gossypium tomentosum]|uniref:non-specific serine/threonine protein kinase n=1 Tax=Gossypium tomentosum TaxID=34277 RepID=A0A5D2Q4S4_GOSTO|nr:hypothetical protein ES332_A06G141900v1 [Gossypium tomentosum]
MENFAGINLTYQSFRCYNDSGSFTTSSTYGKNLDHILDSLPHNVSENGAYALGMCRGDLIKDECYSCVSSSVHDLTVKCPHRKEAVSLAVVLPCIVHYANRPFFGNLEVEPTDAAHNNESIKSDVLTKFEMAWDGLVVNMMRNASNGSSKLKYATEEAKFTESQTIYALMQCTPDLSQEYCWNCLKRATETREECCRAKQGGFVQKPNCYFRWDLHPFYALGPDTTAALSPAHTFTKGQGGFGPVYKGTLADGKEIAVKKLSRTSGQGLLDFKNEVMLIAKLQHRNLVRLLGCCLEKNEKLLVYEFMPNKSLDVFLFDSSLPAQLVWQKRLNIIKGTARGIMHLHEDSRLRIIHRDGKANQNEANTNRVVGTYGYMAPEYAMEGLFSVKSDVFSFGVLLLEIVSGKRNNGFHLSECGESLLTFAWKLWSKGKGMELMDKHLVESSVPNEVLKCIQIGLLCVQSDPADRPTMSTVVAMLGSDTITVPLPAKPALYVGRLIAESVEPNSSDKICSVNEVTISNMSPR